MTHFSHQSFLCFLHPFLSRPSLHLLRPPTVTQPPPYPLDTTAHFPFGVVRCDGSSPEGSLHMAAFYEPLEIYFFLPSLMPRAVAFLLVYFFFPRRSRLRLGINSRAAVCTSYTSLEFRLTPAAWSGAHPSHSTGALHQSMMDVKSGRMPLASPMFSFGETSKKNQLTDINKLSPRNT